MKNLKSINVITNPPYCGSYHLTFFNVGLNAIGSNGRMCIIEPATWLINVRRNGKAKLYDEIKEKIKGHVESVVIENLNNEFDVAQYMPFSTVTIDMSKTFETIDFWCCGEHKQIESLYDCNLIGNHSLILSILDKCKTFGNMMKNHVTNKQIEGDFWYTKYQEIIGGNAYSCGAVTKKVGMSYDGEGGLWGKCSNGEYPNGYFTSLYHFFNNDISDKPLCAYDRGKHLTDKVTDNVYGTKEELENWKYFVFNNKLPLFINICLTIDQNNNSKDFVPWLVDRKYTDDEINQLFNFTEDEVKLIDSTLRKFERSSPWFRRYMCGKQAATDEEVNGFLNEGSQNSICRW